MKRNFMLILILGSLALAFAACEKAAETSGTPINVIASVTAPVAPSGLTAGAVTANSIAVSWTNDASTQALYQIERCTGASCTNYSILNSALPDKTVGYTDSTVSSGTTYGYRVRAVNSAGTSSYASLGNITTSSVAVTAQSCTSSNKTIIDYGQKSAGALGTTGRGLYTDLQYIPSGVTTATSAVTGQPNGNIITKSSNLGTAYIDTGSQSIKYSYWNGNYFKTEVVAGDAVANVTYVKLAYLSNSTNAGIPLIFWTNGAANSGQIMMAVRSTASLTTTGTWTVQAIDASGGATNRALEVSVTPNDQVGLAYQAQTTPSIRFIYCTTNCNDPNNYVAMPSGNRVDTASLTAARKIGLGWCQHSQGNYSPAVVYGITATTFTYAACLTYSTTPTDCLAAANWVKSTTPVTVGAGSGLVSDLYLDPTILKDVPRIAHKENTTGVKTWVLPSCESFVLASAYTAGAATIATGTAGNAATSWAKILKSTDYTTLTNDRFYIVYNDGITDMRWAKTNASNNFNGAYLTATGAASSIHTNPALLAAAGTTTMGADLNLSTKQLVTGYGTSIASSFNTAIGVVNDFTTGDPSTAASNAYSQYAIEGTGQLQLNATQYANVAVAATSSNRPAAAWVDFSSGVFTTGKLKYSLRSSSTASGASWPIYQVPGAGGAGVPAPLYPSLAFDNNNRPWIGYWDQTLLRFVLATNTESDGSGVWTSYNFPITTTANHGTPVGQPAMNAVAVAMYYSSGVAYPVMITTDNGTNKAVRSAKLDPATGAWSAISTIDGTLLVGGAAFLTADFNTAGTIVVAYQNLGAGSIRVKYSASTDGGATWPVNSSAPASVSGLNQGEGLTIKLNPSTNLPAVSYYDRANSKLYYVRCSANCTGSSAPTFVGTAASVVNGLGITNLSGTGNANLLSAALTFSAAGDAYILYNSGHLDMGALRMVDNVGGTLPSGLPTTVVAGANGGYNTATTAATNGGIPWSQQAVRLSNGVLATAYVAPGNWIGVTTCGD